MVSQSTEEKPVFGQPDENTLEQLHDRLNHHQNTININHYLNPIGVVMDGPEQFKPTP